MEESARYLMFHAMIVLLVGLLVGMPYGRAILKGTNQRLIEAWRVAHSSLPIGAILLLALSVSFSSLNVSANLKWAIAVLFIVSGYSFMVALILGPIFGHRGLSAKGPIAAKFVYSGNLTGAITSLLGTIFMLYAAWISI